MGDTNPEMGASNPEASANFKNTSTSKDLASNNSGQKNRKDQIKENKKGSKEPAGGHDKTKIPKAPAGYTIKITIHKAENLPVADINSFSSDPYVVSQLYTDLPQRHKENGPLQHRTFTIRRSLNPEWNADWIIANVPASGFKLKCRIYDEDPGDHDDRLGNAHFQLNSLSEKWEGISHQSFSLKTRMASKRALAIQGIGRALCIKKEFRGELTLSIKVLGKTESSNPGRVYTAGPIFWIKHYSPLLGRLVGIEAGTDGKEGKDAEERNQSAKNYNFQANQIQFHGPVPADLYHRYVEFKPFVKVMFTNSGIKGYFLNKALTHQHNQIYRFDRKTEYGYLGETPSVATTRKFLDLVHYDEGGRIFTYIITLDALMRFTETGKDFGIDFLSKHTMHSAVAAYIAYSGEFLVRRLQKKSEPPPEEGGNNKSHPPEPIESGEPAPKDPANYELIIDNDSGTYRPNADLLPNLKKFLRYNLPGIKIVTLDCGADAEIQQKIKKEQKEAKQKESTGIVYTQFDDNSSVSSSDISDLEDMVDGDERADPGFLKTLKRDLSQRKRRKKAYWKGLTKDKQREGNIQEEKSQEKQGQQTNTVIYENKDDHSGAMHGSKEVLATQEENQTETQEKTQEEFTPPKENQEPAMMKLENNMTDESKVEEKVES